MQPLVTDPALRAPVPAAPEEDAALHSAAVVIERDDRSRWLMKGPQVVDVLNGLITNDVSRLQPGQGCYAAALTPKGKVVADLRVFARDGDFVVETSTAAASGWSDILRKYVNPRLAKYEDVTAVTADLAVAGPLAAERIAAVFGIDAAAVQSLADHHHLRLELAGSLQLVVRTPEIGLPAYDLLVAREERDVIAGRLRELQVAAAAAPVWAVARIANGWPAWGIDMDENTLAQEASLDRFDAISYEKGCYTGQETVARVHFRGHVNRYLRRARYAGDVPIPSGAEIHDGDKLVGDVRSSALSRDGGVAIVMLRREVTGERVLRASWDGLSADLSVQAD